MYLRIPTYVAEIYSPENPPIPTPLFISNWNEKKNANDPSVIRWFDSGENDTYFNLVF